MAIPGCIQPTLGPNVMPIRKDTSAPVDRIAPSQSKLPWSVDPCPALLLSITTRAVTTATTASSMLP